MHFYESWIDWLVGGEMVPLVVHQHFSQLYRACSGWTGTTLCDLVWFQVLKA